MYRLSNVSRARAALEAGDGGDAGRSASVLGVRARAENVGEVGRNILGQLVFGMMTAI